VSHLSQTRLKVVRTVSKKIMGVLYSKSTDEVSVPIFNILEKADAIRQSEANEALDGFEAACIRSEANRRAMQVVEVCAPPSNADAAVNRVAIPLWLQSIRRTNVVFFQEGLPHTREPSTIYLPYNLIYEENFPKTLVHEAIHIHQRNNRSAWNNIYDRIWDMRRWSGTLPPELESRRRLNPDTHLLPLFIWQDRYVPVMVFRRADAPRLTESHCVWYDVKTGGWNQVPPPGWTDFFGTDRSSLCEHPNEMAAYILTDESNSSKAKLLLEEALNKEF
jgi:hypothetical protein